NQRGAGDGRRFQEALPGSLVNLPEQLFIDGAWRSSASGRCTTLINPATEDSFAEVAAADVADVSAAVESAPRAWEAGWRVLAAGNCVVLKPASLSPLTALKLGELAHAAGLPAGVLQVLPGPGSTIGDALVTHPLIRKISFTGSTDVGRRIMELAARDLKRVSLELGGKSPNI